MKHKNSQNLQQLALETNFISTCFISSSYRSQPDCFSNSSAMSSIPAILKLQALYHTNPTIQRRFLTWHIFTPLFGCWENVIKGNRGTQKTLFWRSENYSRPDKRTSFYSNLVHSNGNTFNTKSNPIEKMNTILTLSSITSNPISIHIIY